MFLDVLGVYFRNNQRHIRVHPIGAGVVDNHSAGFYSDRSKFLADGAAGKQSHVNAVKGISLGFFHFIGFAPNGQFLASRAGRSQQLQVGKREIPFVQQIDKFLTYGTRSAQNCQIVLFHDVYPFLFP